MKYETLGEWCKWLEKNFSPEVMIPTLPVIIRLDGNNFKSYTKGLEKPFDSGLTNLMIDTAKFLTKETNAIISYVQSDEITLILYSDDRHSSIYHDGKKQKILSKLTAKCVTYFNTNRPMWLPLHDKVANFDCRIYQTPTLADAAAQLLWRENDATKNSISMLARDLFTHDELDGVNGNQKQDKMMLEKGVNWNELEPRFKRGTYIRRIKTSRPFTADEIDALPKGHNARKNQDLVIERNVISQVDMPIFNKVINKVGVIFSDEEPICETE